MSKRQIVRNMANRAFAGESSTTHAISYVARRIGYSVPKAKQFLRDLNRMGMVTIAFAGQTVIFY